MDDVIAFFLLAKAAQAMCSQQSRNPSPSELGMRIKWWHPASSKAQAICNVRKDAPVNYAR